jgi:hypothetical protein
VSFEIKTKKTFKWRLYLNIFVLDHNPEEAAKFMCDKHVNKMLLETVQLLSTSIHELGGNTTNLYKPTHKNHPCTIWARESYQNFCWLLEHGFALYGEYKLRFKKPVHKSGEKLLLIEDILIEQELPFPSFDQTPFALAIPEEFKFECPVESYRAYYHTKSHFAKWEKGREAPYWWKNISSFVF